MSSLVLILLEHLPQLREHLLLGGGLGGPGGGLGGGLGGAAAGPAAGTNLLAGLFGRAA